MAKNLPAGGAIESGGFLELDWRRLEKADHDPDHDRHRDDEMDDDLRCEGAKQSKPLEREEQRNEIGEAGRDACDQDHDRCLVRPHAGDAVARRHPDREREQRRRAGDDQRVKKVLHKAIRGQDSPVVFPREAIGNQDRWIAGIVDLELDGEGDHPDEKQDRRRHDQKHSDRKPDLSDDFPEAHALPPASFQCMRWRAASMTAASTMISTKKTSAIADP